MKKYLMFGVPALVIIVVAMMLFSANNEQGETGTEKKTETAAADKTDSSDKDVSEDKGGETDAAGDTDEDAADDGDEEDGVADNENSETDGRATIVTSKGDIVVEFYQDVAPNTVENFKTLARKGFYDGLTWHRYEEGFVIQGGDPNGDGTGGPGYNIDAEFSLKPHVTGAISMARSSDPDSAGSQFFIVLNGDNASHLNGQYSIFAIVPNMDVASQLRRGDKILEIRIEEEASGEKATD